MNNEILFQDENHKLNEVRKDWDDLQWIDEFYQFLQGKVPDEMQCGKGNQPKLSPKKAFTIIWYLQEHLRILPDHIEQCDVCKELFNTWSEGIYWESKGKHFCGGCEYLVPENYDRGKRG